MGLLTEKTGKYFLLTSVHQYFYRWTWQITDKNIAGNFLDEFDI